ncbi:hypothetical protein [Pseudomonas coronafaciens]|uniref:hypothetical protein n=1 Tax=Pseudomonas coronafaciens TaxID=53409 RepID=UPI0006E5447B|nr:hypothetical protein [Pseudomonas coronafaciens]KPY25678.1 hypothetical protein ALO89_200213 [Pseudomonas coronafaciens pv. porri]RMW02025.1 hypothetical protein ALP00_200206 [Pseudomonas coronafaciens pv. porri]RMW06621.1 hypothetical protein ALO99_200329 [Pseudomonas coronafaciens pv. porri]
MSNTADRYAYNPHQRTALLVTLALSLLVLLLHFPFDGYVTESSSIIPSFIGCPKGDPKALLRRR